VLLLTPELFIKDRCVADEETGNNIGEKMMQIGTRKGENE